MALVKALLLSRKKFTWIFSFSESKEIYLDFFIFEKIAKKPKNPYFWLPQQKMGSMAGTFTIPKFN
jgi:hypothetical protein